MLLDKNKDIEAITKLAEHVTTNTHFKYTRFEKSLGEQSALGQHIIDTATWFKGNLQNLYKGGIERVIEGIKKKNYQEAYAGLRVLAGYWLAAEIANKGMEELMGEGKKSYGLWAFRYTPGGVALGTMLEAWKFGWNLAVELYNLIDSRSEEEMFKKFRKMEMRQQFNQLVRILPFVDTMINAFEAVNDKAGANAWKIIQKEILKKGDVSYKDAKRNVVEAWQHFLFGGAEYGEEAGKKEPERKKKRIIYMPY